MRAAYPSTFERLGPERCIANLRLPEVCLIDDPKLFYNDHGSEAWYRSEFEGKFPVDCYDVFEMYSNGIRSKEFKQKIKAGKIKRRNVFTDYTKSYSKFSDTLEQPVCVSVSRHLKTIPRVVCVQRARENSESLQVSCQFDGVCYSLFMVRCELNK